MTFDEFLEQAWADHGERAEEVGQRLERLRTHVHWREDGGAPTIVRRLVAALRFGNGEAPTAGLDAADRAHAHAVAGAALAAQARMDLAIGHFRSALTAAAAGIAEGDPAVRALAVTSNNLAAALEEMPSRTAGQTAVMIEAARAAREYWARAGGWLEIERAEYMIAKCELAAGNAAAALAHAQECAAICDANDADEFELFFAQSVLALAYRALGDGLQFKLAKASALDHYSTLAADLKPSCESTLKLIG